MPDATALTLTAAPADLTTEATTWAARAKALHIVDRDSCTQASYLLRSIKGIRTDIQQWFAPHVEAAMATKRQAEAARKALTDERDRLEAPLVAAEATVKFALLAWETEQTRLRLEQERQLQADARQQAEAQTLAAAAALELEARATGDADMLQEAHDILEQPIEPAVVVVQSQVPKVEGVTYRDCWKVADTIQIRELAAAVAAGTVSSAFLLPNFTALNQFARATKGTVTVPGVRIYNDRIVAARG